MKKGGIISISLLLAVVTIWTVAWYSHKGSTEEKFQSGLESYDFSFRQDLGYYIKDVDEETKLVLPNQKMPGWSEFSLDFQKKYLDCYTYSGDKRLWMRWNEKEEDEGIILNVILLDKQGRVVKSLSANEISEIIQGDPVLAELVNQAEQIYGDVYQ